ncbi:hypothetical protein MSSAC_3846 [Methanosarcina siciliae C2J]|uniref:DUF169 domain-containing protein n=3 Tax=Methanosarcina siciliae TaxID=38027 RepID=A0A0E3PGZ4_9EURY|nr:DUF169 domain-containing protein [Methanosarcina siciliae]AKB30166.1 hypothetical protein MSSIT_3447 [Methanosarcina siciliae T4/M]AKB34068.1 hypothetical protein MSSIH_3378 [Methanosarcina siciliae HI350]AKB38436.1 hypothetical protein MSSAC_3846 [Methanosarcina siciliae C2J]
MDYTQLAEKLVKFLDLKYEPVAVKVIKKGEPIPEGYHEPEKNLRHCQSIMKARKGESFVIPAGKHACVVGASSLGLIPTPEKVVLGEFHHNLGMFDSVEAAAGMISKRPAFEPESRIATVVGPLKDAKIEPDVVILVDRPETIYWIIPASTYYKGGRVNFSSAAFQATCADTTILPSLTGEINVSLGCFGCRKATDIENDEMLIGIPFNKLEEIVNALEKLYEGPMPKARQK